MSKAVPTNIEWTGNPILDRSTVAKAIRNAWSEMEPSDRARVFSDKALTRDEINLAEVAAAAIVNPEFE